LDIDLESEFVFVVVDAHDPVPAIESEPVTETVRTTEIGLPLDFGDTSADITIVPGVPSGG
jgi:hypothetical protein